MEQAARRISDDQIDESKLKTKVRRLYDIANVLAALNLIEKTSLETRKPAFKWVGESGLRIFIQEMEQHFGENNVPLLSASNHTEGVRESFAARPDKCNLGEKYSQDLNMAISSPEVSPPLFKNPQTVNEERQAF